MVVLGKVKVSQPNLTKTHDGRRVSSGRRSYTTTRDTISEIQRFLALSGGARQKWLMDLLFALTVFARDTYTVGGNSLDHPARMSRFNYLMHRTVTQLRNEISGSPGLPNDVFAKMLSEEVAALGFSAGDLRKLIG